MGKNYILANYKPSHQDGELMVMVVPVLVMIVVSAMKKHLLLSHGLNEVKNGN